MLRQAPLGWLILLFAGLILAIDASASTQPTKTKLETLGRLIFFDTSLSQPAGQSCASCHNPQYAYADQDKAISPGASPHLLGKRNAPSLSYASLTPQWHFNSEDETWIGGFFYDGRALTLEEQATMPMFDPLEMAIPSIPFLKEKLQATGYASQFDTQFGSQIWQENNQMLTAVGQALAAFQSSDDFAPRFTSKYDAYLRGETSLSLQERNGLSLFESETKGNCAACHMSQLAEDGSMPLFTDFSYDNLGVPKNNTLAFLSLPEQFNPAGKAFVDIGLAASPNIDNPELQKGKFKVPTLRNIAITGPYMHNSFFTDLTEAVEFYNTRDSNPQWSTPEIKENVNTEELGDLKLTKQEVEDIVAFLHTLTDGWQAQ